MRDQLYSWFVIAVLVNFSKRYMIEVSLSLERRFGTHRLSWAIITNHEWFGMYVRFGQSRVTSDFWTRDSRLTTSVGLPVFIYVHVSCMRWASTHTSAPHTTDSRLAVATIGQMRESVLFHVSGSITHRPTIAIAGKKGVRTTDQFWSRLVRCTRC